MVTDIPTYVEHVTMIWETIQKAKRQKRNLQVVWLDLANACVSMYHQLL